MMTTGELIGILFFTIILAILAVSIVHFIERKGGKVGISILLIVMISSNAATSMETFLLSLLGLAAAGFLLYTLSYIETRRLKGSLKIHSQHTALLPGTLIQGELHLKAKKDIEGDRLLIALVGFTQKREEIYRNEVLLEGEHTYHAGIEKYYPFSIPAPQTSNLETLNHLPKTHWELHARLFAKGVDAKLTFPDGSTVFDLKDSKKISIHS